MSSIYAESSYQKLYNQPVGTIFIQGHGQNTREWKLVKKMRLPFGELRMVLQGGSYNKPIYIWYDEYDDDEFFIGLRLQK